MFSSLFIITSPAIKEKNNTGRHHLSKQYINTFFIVVYSVVVCHPTIAHNGLQLCDVPVLLA